MVTMGQQRFQLLQAGRFTERTAHNANQTGLYVEGLHPSRTPSIASTTPATGRLWVIAI
jgi:hypothetical protein